MSTSRTRRFRFLAAAVSVPLVAAAAGCSAEKLADRASEKAAEKIIESAGGEDVDIDIDDDSGEATFRSADGSMFSVGGGELPDGWPDEVPLPDGFTLEGSFSGSDGDKSTFNVTGSLTGDAAEEFNRIADAFTGAGWTEENRSTSNSGGSTMASATYSNSTWTVSLLVTGEDGEDGVGVIYTVVPTDS